MIARALLILALLAASTLARSDGLSTSGGLNAGFPGGLTNFGGAAAAPATPCSGTGLIFNVACNSQYIGTL